MRSYSGGGASFGLSDGTASRAIAYLPYILASDFYLKRGIKFDDRQAKQAGLLAYIVQSSSTDTCFVFEAFLGDSTLNQEIRGSVCYPVASRSTTALEQEMLILLSHAHFAPTMDSSNFTVSFEIPQSMIAGSTATPSASARSVPTESQASNASTAANLKKSSVAPTEMRAPIIGRRFLTRNGFLQVTRVDGRNVTTVNAANQTALWNRGIFTSRPGADLNSEALDNLWPLRVGASLGLKETLRNDSWDYTVRITSEEDVTITNVVYQTFVIEVRDRSVSPTQYGFDRTRTYWYSPELGFPLRFRTIQSGGFPIPPGQLVNWDVVDVVNP